MSVPTSRPPVPRSVVDALEAEELTKLHLVVDTLGVTKVGEFEPTEPSVIEAADVALAELQDLTSTSWRYIDIAPILTGDLVIEEPTILPRADGVCLFYRGCRNELHGDGEQGKGWVACIAAALALARGEIVVYLDWEDSVAAIIGRLRSLGVDDSDIEHGLRYASPSEPLGPATETDARLALAGASLVIIDAVNEAMTAEGLDPNSNADVARWYAAVPRLATEAGATVIVIDHVAKDPERRTKAIGGVHKRNAIDGASYSVEANPSFGRGTKGRILVKLSKDRRGFLRGLAPGVAAPTVAEITVDATDPERIEVMVRPPAEQGDHFRPTTLMQRVSEFLAEDSAPKSFNKIKDAVGSAHRHVHAAVDALIREGYVVRTYGPNRAELHTLTKPFTEDDTQVVPGGSQ